MSNWDSPKGEWWGYECPEERYDFIMRSLTSMLGEPISMQAALY